MISIKDIISDPEAIATALSKRMERPDFTDLIAQENQRRALIASIEEKRREAKNASAKIGKAKGDPVAMEAAKEEARQMREDISVESDKLKTLEEAIEHYLLRLPNVPEADVPAGGKEANEVIATHGTLPAFDFETKDHYDLAVDLKLVDFKRGVKIGGNGKWCYTGDGALLEWGLLNFFVAQHRMNGYHFILPPHILKLESGTIAGQFPKFTEDVFYIQPDEGEEPTHFLLPTAETALVNYYANEIVPEVELPIRLFAYTPCYRKEAGSYRTAERGTIRGNTFNKVEMFSITKPEDSDFVFHTMVDQVVDIMNKLGLHFQVSRLAAGDVSFGMAKTFDIEVWLPSINQFKEVSSVSNAHNFQALRGNIRYKDQEKKKNVHVHTLNGSGLATSRIFPAILEQYQQADGTVKVPEALVPFVGKEYLSL